MSGPGSPGSVAGPPLMRSETGIPDRNRSILLCVAVYVAAAFVAATIAALAWSLGPLAAVILADLAATVVVFAASYTWNNSSFYDPYWSVAPIAMVVVWSLAPVADAPVGVRQGLVCVLVALWGLRLTWNWLRGWQGLVHEDWRYVELRERTGKAWWLVSFAGIHMFPTVQVLLAMLPVYAAVSVGTRPFSVLDLLGVVVAATAVLIEGVADEQLRAFRRSGRGGILASGLWSVVRYPNYLGENLFWWGLFLIGVAGAPSWAWTAIGPAAISLMFVFVSIPMIDERHLARRPGYRAHMERVGALVPRLRGS
jgi:steroid 5-alpha reductase family enzyme